MVSAAGGERTHMGVVLSMDVAAGECVRLAVDEATHPPRRAGSGEAALDPPYYA